MLYILDRNEEIVGLLQSNSDRNKNIYYDDILTEMLSNGADTFTFTSIADKDTNEKLIVGNYIAFKKNNKFKLLQIIEVNENKENILTKEVYCEGAGLELINTVYSGSKMASVNVERFLKIILQDTNWQVGHVSSNLTKTLSLDVEEKEVYSIIQEYLYDFEAEIDFRVEIKGNRVIGRYIDVYSKKGRNNGKRLEINRDIKGISRKISLINYATKLIGEGKNGLNFRDISMEGEINKPLGQNFVINEDAYSRINNKGKHITRKFTYDTEDAYELLRQTHKALKEYSEPKITYEVDVDILDFNDIEIGDYVSISDLSFTPPLLVTARISELETSKTNKYSNKAVLSNFNEVRSGISSIFPIPGDNIVSGSIGGEQINPDYTDSIISDSINASLVETGKLIADKANIEDLNVVNAEIENLKVNKAEISDLNVTNAEIENLKVDKADVTDLNATNANIENLKADKADIADLNATNATIEDLKVNKADITELNAINANIDKLTANKAEITELEAVKADIGSLTAGKADIGMLDSINANIEILNAGYAKIEDLDANKANIEDLNATNATIENLKVNVANIDKLVANKADIEDLNATNANIDKLVAKDAQIENLVAEKADISQLNAANANIGTLTANLAQVEDLVAQKASISDLNATNANVENLKVGQAEIEVLVAEKASINDLKATNASIAQLQANKADIGQLNAAVGEITQLKSEVAEIGTLKGEVADIEHILAGNITAENIQTGAITAGSGIIADGAIGNAQISKIDAGKIEAGTIDTSKVTIQGTNGHLKLKGNRLQVFNSIGNQAKERVSVGDVNGDGSVYGLRVRGADGQTILLDENGVKSEGITDGAITNDKISENANIDGTKLNINSVVNKINEDGTETIQGTKIEVDGTTLNTKLSTITTTQTAQGNKISEHSSKIAANESAINLKVDSQTYQSDKEGIETQLNKNTADIALNKEQIALKVEQTDIDKAKSEVEGKIDTKVNTAKAEIKVTTDKISQNVSNLTTTVNNKADGTTVSNLSNKVGSLETSVNGISGTVSNLETTVESKADANSVYTKKEVDSKTAEIKATTDAITQRVSSTESTTTTLTNKVNTAQSTANTAEDNASKAQTAATNAQNTANTANATANANKTEIASTKSKVSTIETNLSSITSRVGTVESKQTTTDGKVTGLESRMSNAESKITESAITNTVKKNFYTKSETDNQITSKGYATTSEVKQTADSLTAKFSSSGGYNLLKNSSGLGGVSHWLNSANTFEGYTDTNIKEQTSCGKGFRLGNNSTSEKFAHSHRFLLQKGKKYTVSGKYYVGSGNKSIDVFLLTSNTIDATGNNSLHSYDNAYNCVTSDTYTGKWQSFSKTITVGSTTKSAVVRLDNNGSNTSGTMAYSYFADLVVEEGELSSQWTPHHSEIYDGVTTIDKDGVTVTASNVKSKTNMSANGFKITKTDTNEDVFKVNSDGTLYMKGQITVTGGSVPTSNLSGTISSNQLNSSITSDINNAKNNASSALSTANTASTNATNALNTANSVNNTVNSNKSNWNNAYNRVNEWAYGAITGSTNINGGMIATNTITANKMAIADFTNYCEMNVDNCSTYGFIKTTDSSASNNYWMKLNSLARDIAIVSKKSYDAYKGNVQGTYRISFEFNSTVKGATTSGGTDSVLRPIGIGLYCKDKTGASKYHIVSCSSFTSGTNTSYTGTVTLDSSIVSFGVYVQINGYTPFTGQLLIRNIKVNKMANGELIVDGAITADKIASRVINADKIASGTITSNEIKAGTITSDKIASRTITADRIATGVLTANEIKTGTITSDRIASRTITADRIATGVLTANEIAANTITANKIASRTITADKIAAGAITANEIKSSTITATQMAANSVTADKIAAGAITANKIASGAITATMITSGTLDASKVNVTNLNANNITSGLINANRIDVNNLKVNGSLISGQINGVGGIKFADGAIISSYDSHVPGYKGIQVSAPSIKLGDKVDIYSPTLMGTVTGKSSSSSSSSSWTMSSSGGLNCSTINTSSTTTIGGTLNVRNNVINGMNNLQMARGSVNIPIFGTNYTYDYIKGGASRIAFADSGPIHFLYNGSKSSFIAGGTIYLPHAGNANCDHFRLGSGIMASPSSGSFHFLTASGGTSPLYAGVLYSATTLSLKEPIMMSNNSVFDKINSINVIETKNGLRLHNPISMVDAIDESPEVVKTVYNEEKGEIETSIDYTSAISTLWKAVQELKQENDELKEIIKSLCPKE